MPPVIEPTPPSLARQFYRRRAKAHHSQTRRYLRLAIVAFVLIFGWTSWYLAKRGFGKEWRDRVSEELHKRGVEASIQRLTVDPVRGLIAQNVRIYDFKNRENTLAVISEVALDINYAALLHHQPFLNALDVRGAELTIPNPAAAPGTAITRWRIFPSPASGPTRRSRSINVAGPITPGIFPGAPPGVAKARSPSSKAGARLMRSAFWRRSGSLSCSRTRPSTRRRCS